RSRKAVGATVSRLLRHPFLTLLVALLLLLGVYPVMHDLFGMRLLFDVLLTLVFAAAIPVVFRQGPLRLPALVLAVPTLAGAGSGSVLRALPRPPLVVGFHLAAALFLSLTTVTILRTAYRAEAVPADSIYGAFCGYLLIGLTFGHLYCVIESAVPGS